MEKLHTLVDIVALKNGLMEGRRAKKERKGADVSEFAMSMELSR